MNQRMIAVNGVSLHLMEAGQGDAVLLLHGFPEFWYSWRHQLNALSQAGFRAIVLTVLLTNFVGVRVGVPVYFDPIATSLTLGAPMRFIFDKFTIGGLDDVLNIKIVEFAPRYDYELYNQVAPFLVPRLKGKLKTGKSAVGPQEIREYWQLVASCERLSADRGVILGGVVLEEGLPVPWLSFTYHFGNGRAARR